ncbi:MAG TPA: N-acetylmuramoyl-L-alanine amidase [Dongiaceae bacterium]|nr:N-acetylmuramoyl-L-alanine amidase [Dongiaceae bacterium]
MRVWQAPDNTRLVFDLSGPVEHQLFTLQNPDRVVIDLIQADKAPTINLQSLKGGLISNVRSGPQGTNGLRVVLDISQPLRPKSFLLKPNAQYGHRLVVDLFQVETAVAQSAPVPTPTAASTPTTTPAPAVTGVPSPTTSMQPAPNAGGAKPAATAKPPLVPTPYPGPVAQSPSTVPAPAPATGAPKPASTAGGRDIIIAIDAGHGGDDPGASGPRGTREKDVVLQISRRLYNTLNAEKGVKAVLVRNGDYFLPLASRREIARKKYKADLFVSIHADAAHNRKAHGASVFALSRSGATSTLARVLAEKENESDMIGGVSLDDKDEMLASVLADLAMEGSMEHSLKVGGIVLGEVGRHTRLHSRRVEQAGFAVLKTADIPSILVETGFISNPSEETKLRSEAHQTTLARAISKGLVAYFDQHPPPGTYFANRNAGGSVVAMAGDNRQHRIEKGETLSHIAQRYQVSLASLMRYNALDNSGTVRVGQVLRIPNS